MTGLSVVNVNIRSVKPIQLPRDRYKISNIFLHTMKV